MKKILVLEGPNTKLSKQMLLYILHEKEQNIEYFTSNNEGEIINKIHGVGYLIDEYDGIIYNPWSSINSIAVVDAIRAVKLPVIIVKDKNYKPLCEIKYHFLERVCHAYIEGDIFNIYKAALMMF